LKNKTTLYTLVLAVSASLAAPLLGQMPKGHPPVAGNPTTTPTDPNKVVLTAGGETLTAQQFDQFLADLPEQVRMQVQMMPGGRRMLAEQVLNFKLLSSEARKRGLADTANVKRQVALASEQILATALQTQVQAGVDDAAVQKYYDDHKADMEHVTARHILIRAEGSPAPLGEGAKALTDAQAKAKADDIRKRLEKGEDFAKIAKAESDDKGSGADGGSLGSFNRKSNLVKPFLDAAFALKVNEFSAPVKTEFGYHIIQVTERKTPTFEQSKERLKDPAARAKLDELSAQLKKDNKAELDEAFFGPPSKHPMGGMGGMEE
jgi:peptidyl-prolyl cis-trans isomerase C